MDKEDKIATPPPTVPKQIKYAGFGKRFLAYTIDSFIIGILSGTIGALGFSFNSNGGSYMWAPWILIYAAYYIFFWQKDGQTLGNRLLAIKVMREDNKPFDIGTGVIRCIGYVLSSFVFYLGFLWVIWDPKKQGWHDKIAKTVVIETEGRSRVGLAIAIVSIFYISIIIVIVSIIGAGILLFTNTQKRAQMDYNKSLQQTTGTQQPTQ